MEAHRTPLQGRLVAHPRRSPRRAMPRWPAGMPHTHGADNSVSGANARPAGRIAGGKGGARGFLHGVFRGWLGSERWRGREAKRPPHGGRDLSGEGANLPLFIAARGPEDERIHAQLGGETYQFIHPVTGLADENTRPARLNSGSPGARMTPPTL